MKTLNFLGMDYGASNGKGVVGSFDGDILVLNEVNRFHNFPVILPTGIYWDILALYSELRNSVSAAQKKSLTINSIGIDSWAQDFGIIDRQGNLLGIPHSYRDPRRITGYNEALDRYSDYQLFIRTGIVPNDVCTLFQLISMKGSEKSILEGASRLMFIPNLLAYFLTGEISCDSTIASMSLMYSVPSHGWIKDLLEEFGIPSILPEITPHSELIGRVMDPELQQLGAGDVPVISIAQHDTMSAFATVSAIDGGETAYISCGTWTIIGAPVKSPVINREVFQKGLSNEVGYENRIYLTKNITGLWILQECVREWKREGYKIDYDYLDDYAEKSTFPSSINPENETFMQPSNMNAKIMNYCRFTGQPLPSCREEMYVCILRGLADKMSLAVRELEQVTGVKYDKIHIVGGGAKSRPLCRLVKEYSGKQVLAGPHEATVIGNIITQLIYSGEIKSIEEAGEIIHKSFPIIYY